MAIVNKKTAEIRDLCKKKGDVNIRQTEDSAYGKSIKICI